MLTIDDDEPRPPARRVKCKVLCQIVVEGRRFRPGEFVALSTDHARMLRWSGSVEPVGPIEPGQYVVKDGTQHRQNTIQLPFVIEKSATGARKFRATASTSEPDRQGDIIEAAGWDLTSYRKNPTILFAHDYGSLPIARASQVFVQGDKLIVEVQFAEPGVSTKGDAIWQMITAGLLNTLSVGFRPLAWEYRNDHPTGIRFTKAELLEISVVPVPANASALIERDVRSAEPSARSAEPGITRTVEPTAVQHDPDSIRRRIVDGHRAAATLQRLTTVEKMQKTNGVGRNLLRAAHARRRGDVKGEEMALRMAAIALPPAEAQAARAILRRAEIDRCKSS